MTSPKSPEDSGTSGPPDRASHEFRGGGGAGFDGVSGLDAVEYVVGDLAHEAAKAGFGRAGVYLPRPGDEVTDRINAKLAELDRRQALYEQAKAERREARTRHDEEKFDRQLAEHQRRLDEAVAHLEAARTPTRQPEHAPAHDDGPPEALRRLVGPGGMHQQHPERRWNDTLSPGQKLARQAVIDSVRGLTLSFPATLPPAPHGGSIFTSDVVSAGIAEVLRQESEQARVELEQARRAQRHWDNLGTEKEHGGIA